MKLCGIPAERQVLCTWVGKLQNRVLATALSFLLVLFLLCFVKEKDNDGGWSARWNGCMKLLHFRQPHRGEMFIPFNAYAQWVCDCFKLREREVSKFREIAIDPPEKGVLPIKFGCIPCPMRIGMEELVVDDRV